MKILPIRISSILIITFAAALLAGCAGSATVTPTTVPSSAPALTPTQTSLPSPTETPVPTPTSTPTPSPLTIVFYGDSVLMVGDVSTPGSVGYSIVDQIRPALPPGDQLMLENHGGRNAKWAFENLQTHVLAKQPGLVTLWWGMNDLNGCPGSFDPVTNQILQYKLDALLNQHLMYMSQQIKALLATGSAVFVITPIPVLGTLPWSHLDANNQVVWENDRRCEFNLALEQLVLGQRKLVAEYAADQKPVYLVDAWQIYKDHPNTHDMYMDIVHPGSLGAQLIATKWLEKFKALKR